MLIPTKLKPTSAKKLLIPTAALHFAQNREYGKVVVERMRSYGHYIAFDLWVEKDILAVSGFTGTLTPEEAEEPKSKDYLQVNYVIADS